MRRWFYIVGTCAVLFGLGALYSLTSSPISGDISISYLGLTNNPGAVSGPWLSSIGSGTGWHGLFAVTNISRGRYIRLGLDAVEIRQTNGWQTNSAAVFKPELGAGWAPGFGHIYAVPCAAGMAADRPWRVRFWVLRERRFLSMPLHHGFVRPLFRHYGRHTVTSPVVPAIKDALSDPGKSPPATGPRKRLLRCEPVPAVAVGRVYNDELARSIVSHRLCRTGPVPGG